MNANAAEMGQEALEERLQGAVQVPAVPPYRLATLIAESVPRVRVFQQMCNLTVMQAMACKGDQ